MAQQALSVIMLLSAPGDVPPDDLQAVADTVSRWIFRSGRGRVRQVIILPIMWSSHSYSVFGVRPQEALNEQLVDVADFGFAMFANRLGTDTGVFPSGTVEEIDRLLAAGKHVSVVRNEAVLLSSGAARERLRLDDYLGEQRPRGLLFAFRRLDQLIGHLENVLTAQAKAALAQVPAAGADTDGELDRLLSDGYRLRSDSTAEGRGVWPTAEFVDGTTTSAWGRSLHPSRTWYLVLTNTTGRPVNNVSFTYDPEEGSGINGWDFDSEFGQHEAIPSMPPGGTARFRLGCDYDDTIDQIDCIVTWQYEDPGVEGSLSGGGQQQTRATVRAV